MNTSILIRADKQLKERFEKQAKRQGLSMTFLLKSFMTTYSNNPNIVKVSLDDTEIDRSWTSMDTSHSLKNLSKTLSSK